MLHREGDIAKFTTDLAFRKFKSKLFKNVCRKSEANFQNLSLKKHKVYLYFRAARRDRTGECSRQPPPTCPPRAAPRRRGGGGEATTPLSQPRSSSALLSPPQQRRWQRRSYVGGGQPSSELRRTGQKERSEITARSRFQPICTLM